MAASLRGRETGSRGTHYWKPLPSSAVKTMTGNTSLCVIVICKNVVTSCKSVQ
jgi:hypothetical protein